MFNIYSFVLIIFGLLLGLSFMVVLGPYLVKEIYKFVFKRYDTIAEARDTIRTMKQLFIAFLAASLLTLLVVISNYKAFLEL